MFTSRRTLSINNVERKQMRRKKPSPRDLHRKPDKSPQKLFIYRVVRIVMCAYTCICDLGPEIKCMYTYTIVRLLKRYCHVCVIYKFMYIYIYVYTCVSHDSCRASKGKPRNTESRHTSVFRKKCRRVAQFIQFWACKSFKNNKKRQS